jgi:hypothetical protein
MHGDIVKNIFLNSFVVTSTVMVRRSVFDHVGLFEEDLLVAEDDNLWIRIGMKYRIKLLDERLVQYRTTGGSLSSDFSALVTGVGKHIEILRTCYPDLYDRLGPIVIRKKYSDLYFTEAYQQFCKGNCIKSRTRFIDSYIAYPCRIKALLYFLSTYFPQQTIEAIRGIKRCVTKSTS